MTSSITADIDNNGYLDKHDFECMALKMTLIEGKGEFNYSRYQENLHIMLSLWEEIADLADFDKVCRKILLLYIKTGRLSLFWYNLDLALVSNSSNSSVAQNCNSKAFFVTNFLTFQNNYLAILNKSMYFAVVILQKSRLIFGERFLDENM